MEEPRPFLCIRHPRQAKALLHPTRLEILERAREPRSATTIAGLLELPRQRVNYHVRQLAEVGLLRAAGRQRRRNLTEQRYVSTARAYMLSPELLGPLEADAETLSHTTSASRLMALGSQALSELARATAAAAEDRARIAALSIDVSLRFADPAQRSAFARDLREAIGRVVARHSLPLEAEEEGPGDDSDFRLIVGCYPRPRPAAESSGSSAG